ncbi:hypothetical protein ACO0LM_01550 [Undibacterium sp. Di26W]|uniref:hypothetical protein n=1 Tax=Undibacterium sp. Di26W TaxID=3413035 RepID=UPI003BF1106A
MSVEPSALEEAGARVATASTELPSPAAALTPGQQQHLQAYAQINLVDTLNMRCYADVSVFHPINIAFLNLRANSKALLAIGAGQRAIWSEGGGNNVLVGLGLSTSAPALYLRSFLINAREIIVEPFQDCAQLNIALYVRTEHTQLRGRVELPPGASVTLQSRCDRSSLIGLSSFAMELQ